MILHRGKSVVSEFWVKYRSGLLSFLLSLFSLPVAFRYTIPPGLDGSWVKAINYAIKQKIVFGSGLVFTYGPLSYISTRDTHYINDTSLFLADIFICVSLYHVFNKYLSRYKGWTFILAVALFYYKGTEATTTLFLIFIVYTILNLKSNFSNYFEIIVCGLSGIVVFFIKINYGMIAVPILLLLCIYLLFTNRKAFLLLFFVSVVFFILINAATNINILNYVKYGLPIISSYPDAMVIPINADGPVYLNALGYVAFFVVVAGVYLGNAWKRNELSLIHVVTALLLTMCFFLLYKNGFTRADGHANTFFLVMPLFMILSIFLLGLDNISAKVFCVVAIIISDMSVPLPHGNEGNGFIQHTTVGLFGNYCTTLFSKMPYARDSTLTIPKDKLNIIGKSSIDIMPVEIAVLLQNNLNYLPRPVIQTYQAYDPVLDSLNATHFYKNSDRPELVMMWSCGIDNRYAAWDAPMTNAVLHLNYEYADYISLIKDTLNNNGIPGGYLLMHAKTAAHIYPKFEKLYDKIIDLEDTVRINFPDDKAMYMTADVEYHTLGKVKNLLFQPPVLSVSLYFDSSCTQSWTGRIVRPLLREPQLINKAVIGNVDLKNFMTGDLKQNRTVKAFALHAAGRGCKKQVRLTFYKFANY